MTPGLPTNSNSRSTEPANPANEIVTSGESAISRVTMTLDDVEPGPEGELVDVAGRAAAFQDLVVAVAGIVDIGVGAAVTEQDVVAGPAGQHVVALVEAVDRVVARRLGARNGGVTQIFAAPHRTVREDDLVDADGVGWIELAVDQDRAGLAPELERRLGRAAEGRTATAAARLQGVAVEPGDDQIGRQKPKPEAQDVGVDRAEGLGNAVISVARIVEIGVGAEAPEEVVVAAGADQDVVVVISGELIGEVAAFDALDIDECIAVGVGRDRVAGRQLAAD